MRSILVNASANLSVSKTFPIFCFSRVASALSACEITRSRKLSLFLSRIAFVNALSFFGSFAEMVGSDPTSTASSVVFTILAFLGGTKLALGGGFTRIAALRRAPQPSFDDLCEITRGDTSNRIPNSLTVLPAMKRALMGSQLILGARGMEAKRNKKQNKWQLTKAKGLMMLGMLARGL